LEQLTLYVAKYGFVRRQFCLRFFPCSFVFVFSAAFFCLFVFSRVRFPRGVFSAACSFSSRRLHRGVSISASIIDSFAYVLVGWLLFHSAHEHFDVQRRLRKRVQLLLQIAERGEHEVHDERRAQRTGVQLFRPVRANATFQTERACTSTAERQINGKGNLPVDGVRARQRIVDLPQHGFPHGVAVQVEFESKL
jgi:hypothetical protein